ncbi:MAG: hypothetical protein FWG50_13820 [Kiritimatiellaeota bacterium]|nr:hypothetical protein [Kiritimatiellota bacterium]
MKVNRIDENAERLRQTLVLVALLVALPVILAVVFVTVYRTVSAPVSPCAEEVVSNLAARLHGDVPALDLCELLTLRREMRQLGLDTESLDVRIWAESVTHPPVLISVPPPSMDDKWAWRLSDDGCHAVAVASKADAADRRMVGLYDLLADTWVWTNKFLWPDQHEEPHVINRTLVVRYAKNNAKFAMEVSPDGKIVSIDPLSGNSAFEIPKLPPTRANCPGRPVALKHNVFFVTDPSTWHLTGYADRPLPGLYPAGHDGRGGNLNVTRFSGNGRFKFRVDFYNQAVIIEDPMTQCVMQRFEKCWSPAQFMIEEVIVARDGNGLAVFAKPATVANAPLPPLDWRVAAIDVFNGTVKRSANAGMPKQLPKQSPTIAFSRDDRWVFAIANGTARKDVLVISANTTPAREVARVPLSRLIDLPDGHGIELAALEGGNHLLIQCGNDFWLLDLSVMRNYASQLERMAAADYALAHPEETEEEESGAVYDDDDYFGMWMASYKPAPPIAPIALHAEQLYQHQAWRYAVARFGTCMEYAAMDARAPRINPLVYARAAFLAGQPKLGKDICRSALLALSSDRTDYNRMVRYHLQAFYFAEAQ